MRYGSVLGALYGGYEDDFEEFALEPDEAITEVRANTSNVVEVMELVTNKGRHIPCDYGTSETTWHHIRKGKRLLYISGRYGNIIDTIHLHWLL